MIHPERRRENLKKIEEMDREKAIKDLEFCVNGHFKVELSLATKILALLKEQQKRIETLESLRRIEQEGR